MRSVTRFIEERLGLKVNAKKSRVDKPKGIKYLGFGFYYDSFAKGYKARPHPKVAAKFKKLNQLIRGWINYFKIGSMKGLCKRLDSQIRYRLRMCIWKHWKTPKNKEKNLVKQGVPRWAAHKVADTGNRIAHMCHNGWVQKAISNKRLAEYGLISMLDYYTAKCVTC